MNIILFSKKDKLQTSNDVYFFSKNDERYRHCKKILKLKVDDNFKAGIVNAEIGLAKILTFDEKHLTFKFTANEKSSELFPIDIILGFPRPIQLKRCLKDFATFGVSKIHLVPTELGEASYLKSGLTKKEESEKFLLEGASQAGTNLLPKIKLYKNIENFFDKNIFPENTLKIIFDLTENTKPIYSFLENSKLEKNIQKIFIAIGNERGWTKNERKIFEKYSFNFCSLGKRILKTETAVTSSLAIVLSVLEFWKN